jgi:hypothetical protein
VLDADELEVLSCEERIRGSVVHSGPREEHRVKYTFLSKWTVLILTLVTGGLAYFGVTSFSKPGGTGFALLALLIGLLVYAVAWIIALLDSIQERKLAWSILLVILLPVWIGPLLYSFLGPRNTK